MAFKKRKKRISSAALMGIFIAVIMISSVFGVIFFGYNQRAIEYSYGKYKFTRLDNGWGLNIDNRDIVFDFLPDEIENLAVDLEIVNKLSNTLEIDVTSDENNSFSDTIAFAFYSFSSQMQVLQKYVRVGFTTETGSGLPKITCNDSTEIIPVVFFRQSNETKVFIEDNCIIADFKDEGDVLRVKDRLSYYIFGVFNE